MFQGMCCGVEDAGNICWKIAMALRGNMSGSLTAPSESSFDDQLLSSYQKERAPWVTRMTRQNLSKSLHPLYKWQFTTISCGGIVISTEGPIGFYYTVFCDPVGRSSEMKCGVIVQRQRLSNCRDCISPRLCTEEISFIKS